MHNRIDTFVSLLPPTSYSPKKMKSSVLLVISDPNVGIVLGEYLRLKGFDVDLRDSASEAFNAAAKNRYDFCVLGLDDKEALLQLTTDIRSACDTPVFCLLNSPPEQGDLEGPDSLSAQRSVSRRRSVLCQSEGRSFILSLYEAGADDVLVQPLIPDILIAKMRAFLKRWNEYQQNLPQVFNYPNFHFDSITQTLTICDSSAFSDNGLSTIIHLSTKENGVLLLLCRNANQLVERSRILKQVWRADNYFNARSLSVYINRLRHYIEPGTNLRIISMRMRGYKLLVNAAQQSESSEGKNSLDRGTACGG